MRDICTDEATTLKPWVLRGHDRGPEDFDNFGEAVAAIDTIDAAINGWIEGPNGLRFHSDSLTLHRQGLLLGMPLTQAPSD